MRRMIAATSLSLVIVAGAQPIFPQQEKLCAQPVPTTDSKYVPGQVWSFSSRSFEPNATLTILRIETLPKIGVVVHVRFDGIRLRNCLGGPEPTTVQHAPFAREAIDRSVVRLLSTGAVPAYEDGYNSWLSHCGGVYTITAAEMVIADEKTFNSNSGCSI